MRILALTAAAGLSLIALPAQAAWHNYVSHELGFSISMPGDVKAQLGTYREAIAGPRETIVFRSTENNVEYRITAMNFAQAQADGADLIGERVFYYEGRDNGEGIHDEKAVQMDTFTRVGAGEDAVYGRKVLLDKTNNGGRTLAAFYFSKGRLFTIEATVPAKGDDAMPDAARFIDSVNFDPGHAARDATELKSPPPN